MLRPAKEFAFSVDSSTLSSFRDVTRVSVAKVLLAISVSCVPLRSSEVQRVMPENVLAARLLSGWSASESVVSAARPVNACGARQGGVAARGEGGA